MWSFVVSKSKLAVNVWFSSPVEFVSCYPASLSADFNRVDWRPQLDGARKDHWHIAKRL